MLRARERPIDSRVISTPWAITALSAVALVAHYRGLRVPFLLDDLTSVQNNEAIRHLWPLWPALSPAADSPLGGRPLANLSLALNYAGGGLSPAGYHWVNLLLHLATTLGVYGVIWRTLAGVVAVPGERATTGSRGVAIARCIALAAAASWSAHPLVTTTVDYISQRTEALAGFFYVQTLYAFLRSVTAAKHAVGWLVVSAVMCFAGILSKETIVTAPALVLLYDATFVTGSLQAALRRRRSFYASLAVSWVCLGFLLTGLGTRGAGFNLGVSPWDYAITQCHSIATYLKLAIWPHHLVFDYGVDLLAIKEALWSGILILMLIAAVAGCARRKPQMSFVGAAFFLLLAPTSSFVPVAEQPTAENRMYLPLIAVVLGACLLVFRSIGRRALWPAIIGAGALAVLTQARVSTMVSPVALWTDTVAKRPHNARAHASLGLACAEQGDTAGAVMHYETALALDPKSFPTEMNVGEAYFRLGKPRQAAEHFRRAVALRPGSASGYNNWGAALLELGDSDGALNAFRAALRRVPEHVGAHQNAARTLFSLGRFDDAARHYRWLTELHPESASAHYDLGMALARAGNIEEASLHFETALRLQPSAESYLNYARFLAQMGRTDAAIMHLETALKFRPDFTPAKTELDRLRAGSR